MPITLKNMILAETAFSDQERLTPRCSTLLDVADNYRVTLPMGPREAHSKMLDFADNYRVTLPIGPGEADSKRLEFADNYLVTRPITPGVARCSTLLTIIR